MDYSGYESGKCVLVTGAAGFVGSNLVRRLAKDDWFVIGMDSLDEGGDTRLQYARLAEWGIPKEEIKYNKLVVNRHIEKSSFIRLGVNDTANLKAFFDLYDIRVVCHLDTNPAGLVNILENAREQDVEYVVYVDLGRSCSNELFAQLCGDNDKLPVTKVWPGTVYGPWECPDDLPARIADALRNDTLPDFSGEEAAASDFLYIDDVVQGLERVLKAASKPTAQLTLPVIRTYDLTGPDAAVFKRDYGFKPAISLKQGLAELAAWYKEWYTGKSPRINEERIVVGRFPFPGTMTWKYLWNRHLESGFKLSDDPDRLLKSLLVSDGFDIGSRVIEPEDWNYYVKRMVRSLGLKKHMKVFEVGCGGGAFLYPLYLNGFSVGGIDFASTLVHLARLAMPNGRFEVCNAVDLDVTERVDVVVANSVIQYFDSLNRVEAVLLRMMQKADVVAVLNIPDWRTEVDEDEDCRDDIHGDAYNEIYKDLRHLYFEQNWFRMVANNHGWKVRITRQQIPNYGKNPFRFNVVMKRVKPS